MPPLPFLDKLSLGVVSHLINLHLVTLAGGLSGRAVVKRGKTGRVQEHF